MNLREKLASPFDGLRTETLNELEKIADDYAIGFKEFVDDYDIHNSKTNRELLEQYKKSAPYEPI